MTVNTNNIYNQFFSISAFKDWEVFRSKGDELVFPKEVDFSVVSGSPKTTALKWILFPWGLYSAMKWCTQRLILIGVYPAQSVIVKFFIPEFRTSHLDKKRVAAADNLAKKGFVVRHVCLEKNGHKLSGMLVTRPCHSQNGKWVLQACGNIQPIEYGVELMADYYGRKQFNLLVINNPGVGRSEGTATPKTIGAAQEMGISFLETAVKAKKIVLAGYSLGGAAIGQAILKHPFQPSLKYLAIRQMTFDRVSTICGIRYKEFCNLDCLRSWIAPLIHWAGCEMDSVEASKKLEKLQVPEIIIQRVDDDSEFACDGSIPKDATLGHCLHREGVMGNKTFVRLKNVNHLDGDFISVATVTAIHDWEIQHQGSIGTRISSFFRSFF